MARVRLHIHGRVQGVGYRWFVVQQATAKGIVGIVRNETDLTVRVDAVADVSELEEFVTILRTGPPASKVSHIDQEWSDEPHLYVDFRVER